MHPPLFMEEWVRASVLIGMGIVGLHLEELGLKGLWTFPLPAHKICSTVIPLSSQIFSLRGSKLNYYLHFIIRTFVMNF